MTTQQPVWKYAGHIGDVDPIAYGGGFVYADATGAYGPELTWFEPAPDEQWHKTEGQTPLQVYRILLEPPRFKTRAANGETVWHREWFMSDLQSVCNSCDISWTALARLLMSRDPQRRATGYWDLISYYGPYQFDQDPLTVTEDEAYERYAEEMKLTRSPQEGK
jgi:hypothetical protein